MEVTSVAARRRGGGWEVRGMRNDALDHSLTRLGRSLLAAALGFGAGPIASLGAVIGPHVPALGILIMLVAFGALIGSLGLLISCAFVGMGTVTPESSSAYWRGEVPSSVAQKQQEARAPEPCHCTNCLNQRSW